jgi:hypothetical protein
VLAKIFGSQGFFFHGLTEDIVTGNRKLVTNLTEKIAS